MPSDTIDGKVIAITGAGRGIGAATARLLAARGPQLILGARSADELQAVADEVGGVARPTDVTVAADVQALVDLATERFGQLDVLVANAASASPDPSPTARSPTGTG